MDEVQFDQRTASGSSADPRDDRMVAVLDLDPPGHEVIGGTEMSGLDMDELGPTHPVSADLVGRIVAGLAIVSQLLNSEAAKGRDSICDPEQPTKLIVEWGISLAWADNPVLTFADEALIDSTIRVLTGGVSCLGLGGEQIYQGDLVQLHHTLTETITALQAPLWRRP